MRTESWAGPLAWAAALLVGLLLLQPPSVPESVADGEFSVERAFPLLERIAAQPHPTGSDANHAVRDFILASLRALSLTPEVRTESTLRRRGNGVIGARVENILARIPGSESTGTVLLAAHYDSAPTSPGAGDDAAAVAAMLEVARHLTAQPARNDVLLLLTDAEELGLLGAQAFTSDEDLLGEIEAVVNFEARGGGGPSLLFETSDNNAWLIDAFSTAPHPRGNSLAYEVYQRMPNDTDFSVFRRVGLDGLNFAFVDRFPQYHAAIDTPDRLDVRSLQHHGESMLALARALGSRDFSSKKESGNAVFFNVPGAMVRYPASLAIPLALLGGLLTLVRMRKSALLGAVFALITVAVTVAVGAGIALLLQRLHPAMAAIHHPTLYEDLPWRVVVASASFFFALGASAVLKRWSDVEGMWSGGRLLWALLALGIAIEAPGASYLFTWPLLAAAVVPLRWAGVAGAVAVFFCAPIADQLLIALGMVGAPAAAMLYGLTGLLMVSERPRFLIAAAASVTLAGVILGSLPATSSADQPRQESLAYLQVGAEASWLSHRRAGWSDKYLSDTTIKSENGSRNLMLHGSFLEAEAENLALTRPIFRARSTIAAADRHWVRGTVFGKRNGCALTIQINDADRLVSLKIDGAEVPSTSGPLTLSYFASLREGVALDLEVLGTEPLEVLVSEQTFSLPDGVRRSENTIPVPWGLGITDASIVTTKMLF